MTCVKRIGPVTTHNRYITLTKKSPWNYKIILSIPCTTFYSVRTRGVPSVCELTTQTRELNRQMVYISQTMQLQTLTQDRCILRYLSGNLYCDRTSKWVLHQKSLLNLQLLYDYKHRQPFFSITAIYRDRRYRQVIPNSKR